VLGPRTLVREWETTAIPVWRIEVQPAIVLRMPFTARIKELSEQLARSKNDEESLRLAQELQALLHERIELLRSTVSGLPLVTNPKNSKGLLKS
jgi:hypothetical protein